MYCRLLVGRYFGKTIMKSSRVIMVRIYLTESEKLSKTIIDYLTQEAKIRGVTLFRAISGHGETGTHSSSWIDLSLDLPITLEFFDYPDKINPVLEYLSTVIKPAHIVFWEAYVNQEILTSK